MLGPAPFKLMNSASTFNFDGVAKEVWGRGGIWDDDYVIVVVESSRIRCAVVLSGGLKS